MHISFERRIVVCVSIEKWRLVISSALSNVKKSDWILYLMMVGFVLSTVTGEENVVAPLPFPSK